jgi:hypothetical protein
MTIPSDRFADDGEHRERSGEAGHESELVGCELFESVAAELALGSLTGVDRSVALAHLDDCGACRTLIKELATVADALLLAAPEADPPAGFEVRLLARFHRGDPAVIPAPAMAPAPAPAPAHAGQGLVIPLRRRLRAVLAAAAAVAVIAGAGIGVGVAVAPHPATKTAVPEIRVATLRSVATSNAPASSVGEVAITAGKPSWVVMTFHKPGWSGYVECVVSENGQSKVLGSFWMHNGSASWAVPLASSGASVSSAQIDGANGAVFATAQFPI